MTRYWLGCLFVLLAVASPEQIAAQGILLPMAGTPRFSIVSQQVTVRIDDMTATTEVHAVMQNNARQAVEATYLFPIPDGMPLTDFTLRCNEISVSTTRLSQEETREVITTIVQQRREPVFLEWMGTEMMQAHITAIPASTRTRLYIRYRQTLTGHNGVVKYIYPLNTAKLSAAPLRHFAVDIYVTHVPSIKSIYSPSHLLQIRKMAQYGSMAASYRTQQVLPDEDLLLFYTTSNNDVGMNLLTYADPEKGDGYFQLLITPKAVWPEEETQARDIVFVLDTSGSMRADGKLSKAKAALSYCLQRLNPRDRFSVISFNADIHPWQGTLQSASKEHVTAAERFFSDIAARGNTNIDGALQQALHILKSAENNHRVRNILFLTDGLPTVGERNVQNILANMAARNTVKARVFDFGVGYDYNAHFLDELAAQHNGVAENVLPNESLEKKIGAFYTKVAVPLFTDLRFDWGDAAIYDIYPQTLSDLYMGTPQVIVGRYTPGVKPSPTRITLTGTVNGETRSFSTEALLPADAHDDVFIPRLWATRKLGYLENQLRLTGSDENTLTEIIRLSKEFGILSEYTTFLTEIDYSSPHGPIANALSLSDVGLSSVNAPRVRRMTEYEVGADAVSQSYNQKFAMNNDQYAPYNGAKIYSRRGSIVRLGQMRNISQRTFIQSERQWMDINYTPTQTIRYVKTFSPAYFQLANAHPRMAHFMSLGQYVTVSLKDEAIQFGDTGQEPAFSKEEGKELVSMMHETLGVPASTPHSTDKSLAVAYTMLARLPVWSWVLVGIGILLGGFALRRKVMQRVTHE